MGKKLSLEEVQKNLDEIVSQLQQDGGYVEVVKNHQTAAVIVNSDLFEKLQLHKVFANRKPNSDWKLRGSVEIIGDIEEASAEISKSILDSINKQKF
jgi:hypothetical protein